MINSSTTLQNLSEPRSNLSETMFSFGIVVTSAFSFHLLGKIVQRSPTPKLAQQHQWRWKNILVSFVHSLLTGVWSLLCFYRFPKMAEDLISTYDTFSHVLVGLSVGYFFYDISDMLLHNRTRKSYELILHHVVIITCFGIALTTQKYIGYAVLSLVVEINSIFLHTRQLLQMMGVPKSAPLYRLNGLLNLGTYIVFRIATLAWMTRWIVMNRAKVPLFHYTIGSIALAILTLMNIVLFLRLLISDHLRSSKDKEVATKID